MTCILKKPITLIALIIILLGSAFGNLSFESKTFAAEPSRIDVTTTTEDGNTVKGSPLVTAVPTPDKPVDKVTFYAKAKNEPDANYYPYAPKSQAPFIWTWVTGAPWVPDGEYTLKMVINYSSGEIETITKDILAENDSEPNAPESPGSLTAADRTSSSLTLSWSSSSAQKVFDYVIFQDGFKIGETKDTTFNVSGLTAGDIHHFRVKTRDVYNNVSTDDNSITVLTPTDALSIDLLPSISEIQAAGPAGATPGGKGYSGDVKLSVSATDNDKITKVEFYVKTLAAPDKDYWKFPTTNIDGEKYSVSWATAYTPEGDAIIKAVAYDSAGQTKTVTKVFFIDNKSDSQKEITWEPADTPPANRIIGYLAGWSTYGAFDIMTDLDASRLTHLNYAFALIGTDLKVQMGDPAQDPKNFDALSRLKEKYPHLKTVIAIGGWGGSANFIESAATEESREIFANSAVDLW